MTDKSKNIFFSVLCERYRQEKLKEAGKIKYSCADKELTNAEKYLVLAEEFGEVGTAILNLSKLSTDINKDDLRKELIQVMAVCCAWIEGIDKAYDEVFFPVDKNL